MGDCEPERTAPEPSDDVFCLGATVSEQCAKLTAQLRSSTTGDRKLGDQIKASHRFAAFLDDASRMTAAAFLAESSAVELLCALGAAGHLLEWAAPGVEEAAICFLASSIAAGSRHPRDATLCRVSRDACTALRTEVDWESRTAHVVRHVRDVLLRRDYSRLLGQAALCHFGLGLRFLWAAPDPALTRDVEGADAYVQCDSAEERLQRALQHLQSATEIVDLLGALLKVKPHYSNTAAMAALPSVMATLLTEPRTLPQPARMTSPTERALVVALERTDAQLRARATWCAGFISDGPPDRIALVLSKEALVHAVAVQLCSPDDTLMVPSLRLIGNLVCGSDTQTDAVIGLGVLPSFHLLVAHRLSAVRKEALWTLSNITAGTTARAI